MEVSSSASTYSNFILFAMKNYATKSIEQWFKTFFNLRHIKQQKKIGGTHISIF